MIVNDVKWIKDPVSLCFESGRSLNASLRSKDERQAT